MDCTGAPQIPQNFSVPDSKLPHDAQASACADGIDGFTSTEGGIFCTSVSGEESATFKRHLLQNLSPVLMRLPHDLHNLGPAGCGYCCAEGGTSNFRDEVGEGCFAILPELTPHIPQNFPFSVSGKPQDAHILPEARAGISGSGRTVGFCSPVGDPQIPQYFSSRSSGLPQELQVTWMTDSGTTCKDD